ncbi:hypothetical protein AAZX31_15G149200 [Glycine max]
MVAKSECDAHSSANPMDRSKVSTKARVLICRKNYFCPKCNFTTYSQTCSK